MEIYVPLNAPHHSMLTLLREGERGEREREREREREEGGWGWKKTEDRKVTFTVAGLSKKFHAQFFHKDIYILFS